jgi:hypothetical protein
VTLVGLPIALIVSGGGIASLLVWLVGVAICFAIVFFILRTVNAQPIIYTILYVVLAVFLLLLTIDFFFGGTGGGAVIVR